MTSRKKVLFEPWSLGDAIIAAGMAQAMPDRPILAIASRFANAVRQIFGKNLNFDIVHVDLDYTKKGMGRYFLSDIKMLPPLNQDAVDLYSIRGDFRDILAAKKMFPRCRIHSSGWLGFFARKFLPLDAILRVIGARVSNRYSRWSCLTGFSHFLHKQPPDIAPRDSRAIALHVGCQWRSKQYPYFDRLFKLLISGEFDVKIFYGPGDIVPHDLPRAHVLDSQNLLSELSGRGIMICNDSSSLHFSPVIGLKTFVITRVSNIDEWLPPGCVAVKSERMPKGYRPHPDYMSDKTLDGWPEPERVVAEIVRYLNDTESQKTPGP